MIGFNLSGLKANSWSEYLLRFLFGGAVTMIAGVVGNVWGPVIGGLFLAFPAIFPASETLVEKHEDEERKDETKAEGAAAAEAAGAAMGSTGLAAFGIIIWRLLPFFQPWEALFLATVAWFLVAGSVWVFRKRFWPRIVAKWHQRPPSDPFHLKRGAR